MLREVKTLQIDREVFVQTLEKKLADLPPLPAVVTRIMQTVNDPNTSAEDLNRLISLDQGLSSRILRIVNSAYYGFPKRISTITHAVVILGFNTVRNLVLGVSAFGMLSGKSAAGGLNRRVFWEHSVSVAVAASVLARRKRPRGRAAVEEAFLGGLLHDIGKLFLDCYFPVQYAVTLAYAAHQSAAPLEAERKVLAFDHPSVGRRIADHWNFPPALVAAINSHHAPVPGADHFETAAFIHAADWVAWQFGTPSAEKCGEVELVPAVREWLALEDEELASVLGELAQQIDGAREMLRLDRAA
ncbi:MAG: HDOD domain-containing protein [Chthonomonadales bacterium]|nr:HDOD domain-containing protein [Chthonomonadales bacterium]